MATWKDKSYNLVILDTQETEKNIRLKDVLMKQMWLKP